MAIFYESIGQECVTLQFTGELAAGEPCTISANDTVKAGADGEKFCGIAAGSRGGLASVIVKGFVTVPYTGTAPACGFARLAAAGSGKVKADNNGREYAVFAVNTTDKTVTFLL